MSLSAIGSASVAMALERLHCEARGPEEFASRARRLAQRLLNEALPQGLSGLAQALAEASTSAAPGSASALLRALRSQPPAERPARLLLLCPDAGEARLVEHVLASALAGAIEVTSTRSLAGGEACLASGDFAALVCCGGGEAFDVGDLILDLRQDPRRAQLPVVVLSPPGATRLEAAAYALGADACLGWDRLEALPALAARLLAVREQRAPRRRRPELLAER